MINFLIDLGIFLLVRRIQLYLLFSTRLKVGLSLSPFSYIVYENIPRPGILEVAGPLVYIAT